MLALIEDTSSQASVPLSMADLTKTHHHLNNQKYLFSPTTCTSRKTTLENCKTLVGVLSLLDTPRSPLAQESLPSVSALRIFSYPTDHKAIPKLLLTGKRCQHRSSKMLLSLHGQSCRQDSSAAHHIAWSPQSLQVCPGHKGQTSESDSSFASISALPRVNWT